MLPFLKNNKEGSVSQETEPIKRKSDDGEDYGMLESVVEELISAIHSKDVKAACSALRTAFELCDSEPHEEGPHTNAAS